MLSSFDRVLRLCVQVADRKYRRFGRRFDIADEDDEEAAEELDVLHDIAEYAEGEAAEEPEGDGDDNADDEGAADDGDPPDQQQDERS